MPARRKKRNHSRGKTKRKQKHKRRTGINQDMGSQVNTGCFHMDEVKEFMAVEYPGRWH